MRRSIRWLLALGAVLAVLMFVAVCVLLQPVAPPVLADQRLIEARAVQMAQDTYNGTVDHVVVRLSTQGELNPQHCTSIEHLQERLAMMSARLTGGQMWNWCDDSLPAWDVTVHGEFQSEGGPAQVLRMELSPDGLSGTLWEPPVLKGAQP